MNYYPVNLAIEGKLCVVVGGGEVAERKVQSLMEHGARVRVISPSVTEGLGRLIEDRGFEYRLKAYDASDIDGAYIVFAASDTPAVNARVAEDAALRNVPVNVVDFPELCTFIVPAVVSRGDLVIGVSTSGGFPLLARKIRNQIADMFGPEYAEYLAVLRRMRERIKETCEDAEVKKRVMKRLLEMEKSSLIDASRRGRLEEVFRNIVGEGGAGAGRR